MQNASMEDRFLAAGVAVLLLVTVILWFIRFFGEMGADFGTNRFAGWCLGRKEKKTLPMQNASVEAQRQASLQSEIT